MRLKNPLLRVFARYGLQPCARDVRQGEMAECGLAALASLMSIDGVVVPLDRLRGLAASTLYGTSLRTLRQIAIRLGFDARASRIEHVADLAASAPCLVHLDFIHFAVVERVTAHWVLLSDPIAGPVRVPVDRFSRMFTGVILTLKPTPFLRRASAVPSPSRRKMLVRCRGRLGLAVAAACGAGGALAAAALSAGARFDGQGGVMLPLLALVVAAVLADVAIRGTTGAVATVARTEQAASIDHVAGQPAAAFVLRSPLQANALLGAPAALIDPLIVDAIVAASAAVAMFAGALIAEPVLALAGAVVIGVEAGVTWAIGYRRGAAVPHLRLRPMPVRAPNAADIARADGWGLGHGAMALFQALAGSHAGTAVAAMPGAERGAALTGVRAGAAGLRLLVLIVLGATLLRDGEAAGQLLAAGTLVMLTGAQVGRVFAGVRTPGVTAALHRLADRSAVAWGEPPADPPSGVALVLDDVAWRPAEMLPDVVRGVGFRLADSGSLAIVALPRSGATTIARLAAGWLSPSAGTVRARRAILLDARWSLGSGRVRDLLAMDGASSDAAMLDAIRAFGLAPTLVPRGGLDLVLSDGGPELSGGQRRRLMLAAALLRKPPLLVLDGTLDALDTAVAAQVLATCRAAGIAVLLAGHRDDIAALCDDRFHLGGAA